MAERLDVHEAKDPELSELQRDVAPEAVLDELAAEQTTGSERPGRA